MTFTPKLNNLIILQGATFTHRIVWETKDGLPIDITGFTARMQIREYYDSTNVIYSMTSDPIHGIMIDGVKGQIDLNIPATDTDEFTFDIAKYDLELVRTEDGLVIRLMQGSISLSYEITR